MSEQENSFENPHDQAVENLLDEQQAIVQRLHTVQPDNGDPVIKHLNEVKRHHDGEHLDEVNHLLAKLVRPSEK